MSDPNKPWYVPDTQGFLAIAIIALMAIIVIILLKDPPQIDERTSGVLMTIVGVLIACLKDVYSFFFGSSKGSTEKDKAITEIALQPVAPVAPVAVVAPVAPVAPIAPIAPVAPAGSPENPITATTVDIVTETTNIKDK